MGLADSAAKFAATIPAKRTAPTGFEPGVKYEGNVPVEVSLNLQSIPDDEQAYRDEIKRITKLELPDDRSVEIAQVRYWGMPGQEQIYVRFTIADRPKPADAVDYPALLKIIRGNRRAAPRKTATGRTRVVVISDTQIGKVGAGGGKEEFLARIDDSLRQLDDVLKAEPCDDLLIVDPGDLIENDKNVQAQIATNDLSVPEQIELATVVLTDIVSALAARFASTRVVTVPSNHGQYRSFMGKGGAAGKPSDDFGLTVHKLAAHAFAFGKRDDVSWVIPETWRESLAIRVQDMVVGVVHGHQFNPGQAGKWWAGQTHGDQPTAAAHLLIHGHYHNASIGQSGAIAGRPRWIVAADAMDAGSDWFQNISGEVSEPSVTTFTISGDRWDNYRRIVPTP